MSGLLALTALAVLIFFGLGVARWTLRGVKPLYWLDLLGPAWLLGTALGSVLQALGGLVLQGLPLWISLSAVMLVVGWQGCRRGARVAGFFPASKIWERGLWLSLLVPLGGFFWLTLHEPLAWDGVMVWETKARLAFHNGGAVPIAYFSEPTLLFTHPSYPLYLPMTELWVYAWMGEAHQYWVKLLFPFYYVAAAGLLGSAVARLNGRVWHGAAAVCVFLMVPRVTAAQYGMLEGYADLPLGIFYLGAVTALLLAVRDGENGWLWLAGLYAAMMPWVKHEGVILWAVFVVITIWLLRPRWRVVLWLSAPGLAVVLIWKLALICLGSPKEEVFEVPSLAMLWAKLPLLKLMLSRLHYELFIRTEMWGWLWSFTLIGLVGLAWRRSRCALTVALAILLPLLLNCLPYVFTKLDIRWHVETSLYRLISQIVPVASLAIILVLKEGCEAKSLGKSAAGTQGFRHGIFGQVRPAFLRHLWIALLAMHGLWWLPNAGQRFEGPEVTVCRPDASDRAMMGLVNAPDSVLDRIDEAFKDLPDDKPVLVMCAPSWGATEILAARVWPRRIITKHGYIAAADTSPAAVALYARHFSGVLFFGQPTPSAYPPGIPLSAEVGFVPLTPAPPR